MRDGGEWHEACACTLDSQHISINLRQVVAALGHRLVAWSLSGKQNDYWRVHSSLTLSEDQRITALNCMSGEHLCFLSPALLISSRPPCCWDTVYSICVYLNPRERPPDMVVEMVVHVCTTLSWMSLYIRSYFIKQSSYPVSRAIFAIPHVHRYDLAGTFNHLRIVSLPRIIRYEQHDNVVRTYLTTTGRRTQVISHPRPVQDLMWRNSPTSSRYGYCLTLIYGMNAEETPEMIQFSTRSHLTQLCAYSCPS